MSDNNNSICVYNFVLVRRTLVSSLPGYVDDASSTDSLVVVVSEAVVTVTVVVIGSPSTTTYLLTKGLLHI